MTRPSSILRRSRAARSPRSPFSRSAVECCAERDPDVFSGDRTAFIWRKTLSLRALLAAAVLVSVPIAVNGEPQPQPNPNPKERRVCTVRTEIGSRLNRTRLCQTAAERDAYKQDQRRTTERIQANVFRTTQ
jgi:hypothetical protein